MSTLPVHTIDVFIVWVFRCFITINYSANILSVGVAFHIMNQSLISATLTHYLKIINFRPSFRLEEDLLVDLEIFIIYSGTALKIAVLSVDHFRSNCEVQH